MSRQSGNTLAFVAIGITLTLIVALFLLNYNQLIGTHKQAQNAIDAATLQAAKDIGRIVIEGESGLVALVDDSPPGGSINKRPVLGINTLMARIRLDALIADKLGDPIMIELAQQEMDDALKDKKTLAQAIASVGTEGGAAVRDKDGHLIDIRSNAEGAYNANRTRTGFGELDGHLSIKPGVPKLANATNVPVPTPSDLAQVGSSDTVIVGDKTVYKANVAISTKGLSGSITLVPIAAEPALIENQSFDGVAEGIVACAVQVSGKQKVSALSPPDSASVGMVATAQVGGPLISGSSGVMTITMPGAALVGNGSVSLENPMALADSAGKWNQGKPGEWLPSAHNRATDDASQAFSVMTYDWIRSLGLRPDIQSMNDTLKRQFNTIAVVDSKNNLARESEVVPISAYEIASETAAGREVVAIDGFGIEHVLNPIPHYQFVQGQRGSFTTDLGGAYSDTQQTVQWNWVLQPSGTIASTPANPDHYPWLDPSNQQFAPNFRPGNSTSIPPRQGIQCGTAALVPANISSYYTAPYFTYNSTIPVVNKPARYYSFSYNCFFNLNRNGKYVADPTPPTLKEVCSPNGVQVDAPWIPQPYHMGSANSICPHHVYIKSLSSGFFEINDRYMNVGPMQTQPMAYNNIFRYPKPTQAYNGKPLPPPTKSNSVGVVMPMPMPTPTPTSPIVKPIPEPTSPTPTVPSPVIPSQPNQPPSNQPSDKGEPPATVENPPPSSEPTTGDGTPTPTEPPPPAVIVDSYTYLYYVQGDASNPNSQGSGQIKVVSMIHSPFGGHKVLSGQSYYNNPEANLVYAGETISKSLTWKVRGRDLNASNTGTYFADSEADGYSGSQGWCTDPKYGKPFSSLPADARCPSLVAEWVIYLN